MPSSPALRWGIQPITYGLTWDEGLAAALAVEASGIEYLWGHDHLWSTGGDPLQPFFEGWTTITAWAARTSRVRLGILVGANPFRAPAVVAKMAATVDHLSGGRFVLGMGAGNRPEETRAQGLDPGQGIGERLDRLDESLSLVRRLLAGETVTHHSANYALHGAALRPLPLQAHLPIAVGGGGERKALRVVARQADIWHHWLGPDEVDVFARKARVLDGHLRDAGRAPGDVERHVGGRLVIRSTAEAARAFFDRQVRLHGWDPDMTSFTWAGTAEQVAGWAARYREAGADAISVSVAAPLDLESIERLGGEVRPMLDGG